MFRFGMETSLLSHSKPVLRECQKTVTKDFLGQCSRAEQHQPRRVSVPYGPRRMGPREGAPREGVPYGSCKGAPREGAPCEGAPREGAP